MERKAHEMESPHVCTLCILLAVLDMQNCLIYQTLEALSVDIRELKIRLKMNLSWVGKKRGRLPWTPRVKFITTEGADREARARNAEQISMEDIVLAIMKENSAAAKDTLENWITADQLAERLYFAL